MALRALRRVSGRLRCLRACLDMVPYFPTWLTTGAVASVEFGVRDAEMSERAYVMASSATSQAMPISMSVECMGMSVRVPVTTGCVAHDVAVNAVALDVAPDDGETLVPVERDAVQRVAIGERLARAHRATSTVPRSATVIIPLIRTCGRIESLARVSMLSTRVGYWYAGPAIRTIPTRSAVTGILSVDVIGMDTRRTEPSSQVTITFGVSGSMALDGR